MSLIDPKDIPSGNFFKPTDLPARPVKLKLLGYKKMTGEKFCDKKTGLNHHFKFQILDPELRKSFGDEQGVIVGSNWNSVGWLIALNSADVNIGDTFTILRTGAGFDTKYHVDKESDVKIGVQAGLAAYHSGASAPVVADATDTFESFVDDGEVNISDIPF